MKKRRNNLEDYMKVHNLAIGFRDGNKDDGIELIRCFKSYIDHYVDLIKFGEFDYTNKSIKKFVSIFYYNSNNKTEFLSCWSERAKNISELFSNIEKEEAQSVVRYSILKMAKSYNSKEPTFHTYVSRCLHLIIYQETKKYISDPLSNYSSLECEIDGDIDESLVLAEKILFKKRHILGYNINENDDIINKIDIYDKINNSRISKKVLNFEELDDSFLDINWINGITCSRAFKNLTPFERKLLIEHEVLNKTDTEIANEYGYVRATINRKRLKAISKIKEEMNIN